MELFNPLDFDKWRGVIQDFDAKREAFLSALADLKNNRAPNAELEKKRQELIGKAGPIKSAIDATMKGLDSVRSALRSIGHLFNKNTGETLNELGLAPILLGVTIAGVSGVIAAVSLWLKSYNDYRQAAIKAGYSPAEIAKSSEGAVIKKVLGIDIRWLVALGALAIAGPFVFKQLEKRL